MKMTKTKAIVAAVTSVVTTFLSTLAVALEDGAVSQNEWLTVAIATVGAVAAVSGAVYAAPANRPVETDTY